MSDRSKVKEKSNKSGLTPRPLLLQRKCACGSHTIAGSECESCKQKEADKGLQRSAKGDELVNEVPPIVDQVLNSPGQPLNEVTRADMERRFGHDFSQVRVHSDARAGESADVVNAQAYTVGRDVVFGAGRFSEQSAEGQKLLAHELAHVAQPSEAGSQGISQPGDAGEREADRAAEGFARGETVKVGNARGAAIQRQSFPDFKPDFNRAVAASDKILEEASPFVAAALGSETLDSYDTGKSELKPAHLTKLVTLAHRIEVLLRKYDRSTITVIGHADTVGAESSNLELGQQRADVVKQALSDLGVSDAIISTESKGEGAPQAVKTKDKTPSAPNRRVEIRFHPKSSNLGVMPGKLIPPTPGKTVPGKPAPDEYDPLERPPIDFNYHPKIEPHDPTKLPPDFWKPIPPLPKGSGPKSALDVIAEKILDPVIDSVAAAFSKDVRDKIKEGARAAVTKGAAKGARAAAEAAGVHDPAALDAIEKATEAAIQEKGKSNK